MKLGDEITAVIQARETYRGRPLKPECRAVTGCTVRLRYLWTMDDDEKYPGEFALAGADEASTALLLAAGIAWIASGDVKPVSEWETRQTAAA